MNKLYISTNSTPFKLYTYNQNQYIYNFYKINIYFYLTTKYFCVILLNVERRCSTMICLEYILELHHMSQAELADALGIKPQNLTLWLKGKQDVSKKHLPAMEKIFGVPQEYFQKELTQIRAIELQYLKKFGKPLQQISDTMDEDLNTLELIVSNYYKGVVMTSTTYFMFQTITCNNEKLILQKEFSFDKVTLDGNDIKGINYPDELFDENCDVEIVLKNGETIKILLFDKKMEALMGFDGFSFDKYIIEPEQFVEELNNYNTIKLTFEYSESLHMIHPCSKWSVEHQDDDSFTVTFFPKEIGELQRFSIHFNEAMDNVRIYKLAPGFYKVDIYDAPFATLDIQAT